MWPLYAYFERGRFYEYLWLSKRSCDLMTHKGHITAKIWVFYSKKTGVNLFFENRTCSFKSLLFKIVALLLKAHDRTHWVHYTSTILLEKIENGGGDSTHTFEKAFYIAGNPCEYLQRWESWRVFNTISTRMMFQWNQSPGIISRVLDFPIFLIS